MPGAPIYLISACASAEEFVAAFRRYADRGSLFVPIAEPLPPGRRGRVAVALRDGGVMLEGEVEITSSSKQASILHGRIGMTIRFVEPDDSSRTLLTELDKARVAIRLAAINVTPRPANVPPEPRPVVPAPAGRIDAANALAECVAIGDLTSLREGSVAAKPGGKFALPSIPGAGSKVPTIPPKFATAPAEPVPITASRPFRLPTPPPTADVAPRAKPPTEPPPDPEPAQIVNRPPPRLAVTTTQQVGVVPAPSKDRPRGTVPPPQPRLTKLGIAPITRTPPMPMPVVSAPEVIVETEESTDVADLADVRSTAVGLGVPPPHDTTLMASPPSGSLTGMPAAPAQAQTDDEEGDWTMAPDDVAPTPLVEKAPAGPMTGNWTIALTSDGWSEPEKVAASLPVPGPPTAVSGETTRVGAPLIVAPPEPAMGDEGKIQIDPTLMEPLGELSMVDSSPVPARDAHAGFTTPYPPTPTTPPPLPPTFPMAYAAPIGRPVRDVDPTEYMRAQDPTSLVQIKSRKRLYVTIASAVALVAIGIVAVVVMTGGKKADETVQRPAVKLDAREERAALVDPGAIDAGLVAALEPDAAVVAPVVEADASVPAAETCAVEIQAVPKEVEVSIDNTTKIGTAPGTVQLPCGAEVKLYFRRAGYAGAIKSIMPSPGMKPVKVALARSQFAIKVSSTPAGASIMANGKAMGITPTLVRIDGNQPVVLTIAKDGYAPQDQKVAPKATAQVVHVKLVPKKRSR